MKGYIIIAVALFMIGSLAVAGGRIEDGFRVDGFAPKAQTTYASTKADITVPLTGVSKVGITPTAAVTRKLNGLGTGVPQAQNVEIIRTVPNGAVSYVFTVTSSASPGTKLYVETE